MMTSPVHLCQFTIRQLLHSAKGNRPKMGKKGFSRKAFLKPTNVADNEEDVPNVASDDRAGQKVNGIAEKLSSDDPASRFLAEGSPDGETVGKATGKGSSQDVFKKDDPVIVVNETVQSSLKEVQRETKGQLLQRHKKEWKAYKDVAKKLGKKRKDEAEQLERDLEARHKREVEDWEVANPDLDAEKDTTVLSTTSGLYDLKIGADEERDVKKPTKAQKRRELREKEEAEREARIAEEQASLGPSARETEAAELARVLEPLGYEISEIPADGHCMYRSIGDQLRLTGEDSERDVQQLREETASYIRAFPDDFYPFIVKEESGKDQEDQLEEYCTTLEETAAWGGQIELQALAQSLERQILVYSVGLPVVQLGKEYEGEASSNTQIVTQPNSNQLPSL